MIKKLFSLLLLTTLIIVSPVFGYQLTITNKTAAQTIYLNPCNLSDPKLCSIAAGQSETVQVDWGTIYNIQYDTVYGGKQIIGSLKRDSNYYVLQTTQIDPVAAWQDFHVAVSQPGAGTYDTYLPTAADPQDWSGFCNRDGAEQTAGITCLLQPITEAEPNIALTVSGGTLPHQTAQLVIQNNSTRTLDVSYNAPDAKDDAIAPNTSKEYVLDTTLSYTIKHIFGSMGERIIGVLTRQPQAGGLDAYQLTQTAATIHLAWMGVSYQITPDQTAGGYFTDRTALSGHCVGTPAVCDLGAQTKYVITIIDDPQAQKVDYTYDANPLDWNPSTTYTHNAQSKCPRVTYKNQYYVGCYWTQGNEPDKGGAWQAYDPYFNLCGNCN